MLIIFSLNKEYDHLHNIVFYFLHSAELLSYILHLTTQKRWSHSASVLLYTLLRHDLSNMAPGYKTSSSKGQC